MKARPDASLGPVPKPTPSGYPRAADDLDWDVARGHSLAKDVHDARQRNPVRHRQPSGMTVTSGRPLWQQWSYAFPQVVGDKIDRHQPDPAQKDIQRPADTPIASEVLIGPLPALTAGR